MWTNTCGAVMDFYLRRNSKRKKKEKKGSSHPTSDPIQHHFLFQHNILPWYILTTKTIHNVIYIIYL